VGVALIFGLIVLAMIYTFGDISGAHINPAGIAIGAVIGLEALFAGPICGALMNPARCLAPALVSGHLGGLWIYLVAPVLGGALGVMGCRCVRERGCCSGAEATGVQGT
jgi:glycerol uptake facilitator-like aquaporin